MKKRTVPIASFFRLFISLRPAVMIMGLLIMFLSLSCSRNEGPVVEFSVTETAGIPRPLEYIEVEVTTDNPPDPTEGFSIREQGADSLTRGQLLSTRENDKGNYESILLFPVSVEANQSRVFEVLREPSEYAEERLITRGEDLNLTVDNSFFRADLTDRKATPENGLGTGQLAGLTMKHFNDKLLERSHLNMHWAPNFQKEDAEYKTFGHINQVDSAAVEKGPYSLRLHRSGRVEGYEEIQISYTYEFYAGLPYFLFSSLMEIREDVELVLLRNDEMTMDSLFTHVMYEQSGGRMGVRQLYVEDDMKALEANPIDDDAPWLAFFNNELNFGFGSIRLEYDNMNTGGQPSPMYGEHTKITSSAGDGRYWNRRLVHDHLMLIPEGSRYREKNAYIAFEALKSAPSNKITNFRGRLHNPLQVQYLEQ